MQLQSKRIVTAQEVSDKYGINIRTVYRDIKALHEAGIPVGSEAGTGNFMMQGYTLPPIAFTKEEANAFITTGKLVKQNSEDALVKDYGSGLSKIKSVLKLSEKDAVELLEKRIAYSKNEMAVSKSDVLSKVQLAITSFTALRITYDSISTGEITHRTIEPMGVYFSDKNWILIAHCQLRIDLRDFRLDRIRKITSVDEKSEKAKDFVLSDYFRKKNVRSSKAY